MIPQISVRMVVIVVLGVFLGSAMDAIAGGGGIVTVPAYLLAGLPIHWALGTNKLSAGLGTIASAARYVRSGLVIWRLALPCIALTLAGSFFGTKLQLMIPEVYLKFLLLAVLPVVAFFCLRKQSFSEGAGDIDPKKQMAIVCAASLLLGAYNGFYGPGTGTFLLLVFCGMEKLDVRRANGNVKLVNAASDLSSVFASILAGKVFYALGLIAVAASVLGHLVGAGLAIRYGTKLVRPVVLAVLALLAWKVLQELL